MTVEEVNARRHLHEANARIVLALSILRGRDWCPDCRRAASQAQAALLGATVTELAEAAAS
jgi:hypothetical protein